MNVLRVASIRFSKRYSKMSEKIFGVLHAFAADLSAD